jgi:hypothetical protein
MPNRFDRRQFVRAVPALGLFPLSTSGFQQEPLWPAPLVLPPPVDEAFPTHPAALAKEIVGAAHTNMPRVRELVGKYPTLAKAAWDWGFGDWETPLGAASHVGQRAIAEFLIENGAGPTIFSAAMLGQLAVVQAFAASVRDVQTCRGPHGITLLAHAKAGGAQASAVVTFLESLGSDRAYANAPVSPEDQNAIAGTYSFGTGPRDRFIIDARQNQLGITRVGATRRNLFHVGGLEFHPAGAPSVRIRVERAGASVSGFTVTGGDAVLLARKQ